jgi:hypothetical protein
VPALFTNVVKVMAAATADAAMKPKIFIGQYPNERARRTANACPAEACPAAVLLASGR